MSTRRETRVLTRLAVPIIVTQIGTMLMGTVDVLMIGRVNEQSLAAASIGNAWSMGTLLLAMGLVFGVDPIVTQAHGARDGRRAGLALQGGWVVGVLASLPLALGWAFTESFLLMTGQDPVVASMAHDYMLVQIPTLPLFLMFTALRQYLQGRGILRPALFVIAVANVVNAFLNWVLIFGALGFPELGLVGAGIATAGTRAFLFLFLLWIFRRARLGRGAWVPWSRASFARENLGHIVRHGAPIAVQMGLEVWAFALCTLMSGRLGTTSAAAHAVVLNMASLSFMVPLGIAQAAVTRVGNLIGADQREQAQRAAWCAFGLGGLVMLFAGLLFATLRNYLPLLYTDELAVVELAALILPIAAAFQIFDGLQVVGSGILRGMGRTLPAAWFNLLAYYVLALPLAWWMAFELELGLAGIWWGLALGLAVVAGLLLLWVHQRGPARVAVGPG